MKALIAEHRFADSEGPLTPQEKWLFRLGLLCFLSLPVALLIPHPAGRLFVIFMLGYRYGPKNGRKSWLGVWSRWLFLGFRPYLFVLRGLRMPLAGLYVAVIFGGAIVFAFGGLEYGPYAPFKLFVSSLDQLGVYLAILAGGAYRFRKRLFPGVSDQNVRILVMVAMLAALILIWKARV